MLQWRLTKKNNLTLLQRMLPKGHNSPHADDERRQGQHVEEIRHGEVGHVDDSAAPAARPTTHAPQQGAV